MKNIIVLKQTKSGTSSYYLSDKIIRNKIIAVLTLSMFSLILLGIGAGYLLFSINNNHDQELQQMQLIVDEKVNDIDEFKNNVNRDLDSLAKQIGGLFAQSLRLNALGNRLTEVAKLDEAEFDFSKEPGIGGAEIELTDKQNTPENLFSSLYSIKSNFEQQESQLFMLSELLNEQNLDLQIKPSGKPIRQGWISSSFGDRVDPFTGKQAYHSGIDYSGKSGSIIQSVADGVVIWAGKRGDYGKMVEIDHGSGYITRYAHLSKIDVSVGEKLSKAQAIGIMGKTGRATSEHLHFEVLKKGEKINPTPFIANK